MTTTELLYQLQNLDEQKEKLETEIEESSFKDKLNRINSEIEELNKAIAEKKEELEGLKDELKELEFDSARLSRDEENYQGQLYSGETSNPKELEQIQDKLSKTQQQKEEIEEQTLDLMIDLESKEDKINKLSQKKEKKETELAQLEENYQNKKSEIKNELAEIPKKKEKIKDQLTPEILEKYNKLYQLKNGKAVAKLKENYCLGCRMTLPVNVINKVKTSDELITCDNCGRILYSKG